MKKSNTVAIPAKSIMTFLIWITGILFLLNIGVIIKYSISPRENFFSVMFNFDIESNVPSYFSTYLLLMASLLLALIATIKRKQQDAFTLYWVGLSVVFLLLSLDESIELHNRVGNFLGPLKQFAASYSFLKFVWVIPGALFVGAFVMVYLRFLLALPDRMQRRFCVAGAVYVLGAIGFEMLGSHFFIKDGFNGDNLVYMIVMTIEETLEMTGALLFISALLEYLQVYAAAYKVKVV